MSLSDDARDLMQQGADMRREINGVDSRGNPQMGRMEENTEDFFPCYFSPDRNGELSFELGFKEAHDLILRVNKNERAFNPTSGKSVRLIAANSDGTDLIVRIATPGTSGINPEHVVGCKAPW